MPSAWFSTPLDVYERHVELPHVGQAGAIREILAEALAKHSPASLLYLGCAGGNGLDAASRLRVVGLELNPEFVAVARARYPRAEFHVCDLNCELPAFAAVEMAFGALVFEYLTNLPVALRRLAERVVPGGGLVAPLLGASAGVPEVLPSPYLRELEPLGKEYQSIDPERFIEEAAGAGFILEARSEMPLPSGKRFSTLELRRV
jgi:SAM-dependent methyltransferase